MSPHVLFNLIDELRKRDKMRGLSSILSRFRNGFNKFKNTGARMLDSTYSMTLDILNKNRIFGVKTLRFCRLLCNVMDVISGISVLMHGVISLQDAMSYVNTT